MQFLLTFDTDFRQQNVAAVAQELVVVHKTIRPTERSVTGRVLYHNCLILNDY